MIIKRLLLFIIFAALLADSGIAQVHQVIDVGFSEKYPESNYWAYVYSGRFEFEELPVPLKATKVNYTLKAGLNDSLEVMKEDWDLHITFPENAVEIIGDTVISWPGPHKTGDIMTGSFEFIPKATGRQKLWLYPYRDKSSDKLVNKYYHGAAITWCFDEKGKLLLLARERKGHKEYYPIRTYFFEDDSLTIKMNLLNINQDIFDCIYSFKTLPRIGDTTVLYYTLLPQKDVPDGCDLLINGFSVDICNVPHKFDYPISEGMVIKDSLIICPLPVKRGHGVFIHFEYFSEEYGRRTTSTIGLDFVFNNDGTPKYISNGLGNVPESEYPTVFREPISNTDNISIKIDKDSNKPDIR